MILLSAREQSLGRPQWKPRSATVQSFEETRHGSNSASRGPCSNSTMRVLILRMVAPLL